MLSKSKIKDIQSLSQKKLRDEAGVFIAEGPKLVQEILLEANIQVKEVFATNEWLNSNPVLSEEQQKKLQIVEDNELKKISTLSTPNQVVGIFMQPEMKALDQPDGLILMLDTIQDPGNLGTIIRCADWFGIQHIICSSDSADCFNPKVVQSTMGSIARVNIHYENLEEILKRFSDVPVYAAMLDGIAADKTAIAKPAFLLIGNEAKGIRPSLLHYVKHRVTIPRIGHAESLNAAVATGILLYALRKP